jgi:hypothetical protein
MLRSALAAIGVVVLAGCGGSGGFTLGGPIVDASHTCALGSSNSAYDVQAKIAADNSTSKAVDVTSIDAVLVVASVHGQWQQAVGAKYDAGEVQFSPRSIGANAKATVTASIPSACTNAQHPGTNDNYADYTVQLTVNTSDGTFHLTSSNRHRIVAP